MSFVLAEKDWADTIYYEITKNTHKRRRSMSIMSILDSLPRYIASPLNTWNMVFEGPIEPQIKQIMVP